MLGPRTGREARVVRRGAGAAKAGPGGFTLIETAMATVILGVGVVAMVDAQEAFTRSTLWSSHAATGTFLANEVRELSRHLSRHDPVTGLWLDGGGALKGWGPETGETTIQSFDDLDDLDGMVFGEGGNFPGPINAFGEVIPEIDDMGQVRTDEDGVPLTMTGWRQRVIVEKVSPFDFATTLSKTFFENGDADWGGRRVDGYPLRVTVIVTFQRSFDLEATEVARVSWVVPE